MATVQPLHGLDPEVLPGWETLTRNALRAVALPGAVVSYNSVAVGDLDNDATNGLEVAVATPDGQVSVVAASGAVLWTYKLPNHNCTKTATSNKSFSSPAIGELFGDGKLYIVVGYGGFGGAECGGGVIALDGQTGLRRWHFDIRRFVKKKRIWAQWYSVFGTPLLADLDGDGTMEVAFGSFDRGFYVLNARGKPIIRYSAADTIFSSPAAVDINGDGRLELIVATDISRNDQMSPPTQDGGILYALRTNDVRRLKRNARKKSLRAQRGRRFKHYSFRSSSLIIWQWESDQTLGSSPVVAELDSDNPGLEIVIGSGCYFPENSDNKRGKWFKVLSLRTGAVLNTLPITACSPSSAAVGDIDEDGILEIVVAVNGSVSLGGDGSGRLMAFKANSATPIWSIIPRDRSGNMALAGNFASPIIADLDGNGSLEVLMANSATVGVYAGSSGEALTCQESSCDSLVQFKTGNVLFSTPTVADINSDGKSEIIIAGGISNTAALFGWTGLDTAISSLAGSLTAYHSPWPTHRGNAQRIGVYSDGD